MKRQAKKMSPATQGAGTAASTPMPNAPAAPPDASSLAMEQAQADIAAVRDYDPPVRIIHLQELLEKPEPRAPGIGGVERDRPADDPTWFVGSTAPSTLADLRRASILEAWFDTALEVTGPERYRPFAHFWRDAAEWRQDLDQSGMTMVQKLTERAVRCLLHVLGVLESGQDYLNATWDWLTEAPDERSSLVLVDGGDRVRSSRLACCKDAKLVARIAGQMLDRELITPEDLGTALTAAGQRQAKAILRERLETPKRIDDTPNDLIPPKKAAEVVGRTVGTLNNWKSKGKIPDHCFVKVDGARIQYRRRELLRWYLGQGK